MLRKDRRAPGLCRSGKSSVSLADKPCAGWMGGCVLSVHHGIAKAYLAELGTLLVSKYCKVQGHLVPLVHLLIYFVETLHSVAVIILPSLCFSSIYSLSLSLSLFFFFPVMMLEKHWRNTHFGQPVPPCCSTVCLCKQPTPSRAMGAPQTQQRITSPLPCARI